MNRVKPFVEMTIILVVLSSTIVLAQKRDKKLLINLWIIITKKVYCLTLLQPRKRRQQVQRFIAKRYCCTVPKKQHDFTIKYQKLLLLIATNSIPLIKLLSIS
jgi:hypothetical protein